MRGGSFFDVAYGRDEFDVVGFTAVGEHVVALVEDHFDGDGDKTLFFGVSAGFLSGGGWE